MTLRTAGPSDSAPQKVASTRARNGRNAVSVAYSSAHAVVTNIVQVIAVLITTAILAHLLGPADKGIFDLYVASVALLTAFLSLSIHSGIVFVVASRKVDLIALRLRCTLFAAVCGLAAFTGITAFSRIKMLAQWLPAGLGPATPTLIALGTFALVLSTMARSFLTGQRHFLYANYGDVSKQGLTFILLFLAVITAHLLRWRLLMTAVIANILAVLFTSLTYFALVRYSDNPKTGRHELKACLAFGLPCYAGNVVQFLNYRMDVFFVNKWHGVAAVGIYQVGVLIAQAVNLIPTTVQGVLFPSVSAAHAAGNSKAIQVAAANRLLTLASAGIGMVLFFLAPFLIQKMFGPPFRGAATALQILIPGCVVFVTANVIAGYFAGIAKPHLNAIASVLGLGWTIIFDLLLIPRWGYLGAAWASTASYACSGLVTAMLYKRETGMSFLSLYLPQRGDWQPVRLIARELKSRLLAARV